MKFLKFHKLQYTDKLFLGKYKYKIVLSSGLAGWFRGGNIERIDLLLKHGDSYSRNVNTAEKTFAKKLNDTLKTINEFNIRVETPHITVYLENLKDLEVVTKVNHTRVRYISIPDPASENKLINQTVIVKKIDFDFKVTIGAANQNYISFVNWCQNNPKVRLPKRAAKDLSKDYSAGGGFFYVKDDKSLTMVKMFLGRTITKVENVVRA